MAGVKVGEQWLRGFTCYGVQIESDAFVKHSPRARVQDVIDQMDKVMHLLRDNPQAARSSSQQHALINWITA